MATIRKNKSGSFEAIIRIKGLKSISRSFKTKTLATRFVREVEGDKRLQLALGSYQSISLTLSTVVEEYINQYSGKDPYIGGTLGWWCKEYGDKPLSQVTQVIIREGINKLASTPQRRGNGRGKSVSINKKRSGATINKYKANLSSVFEFAKEHHGFETNPCRSVKSKPINPPKDRYLTTTEQITLLDACNQSSYNKLYLVVLIALTTGARKSEILNLQWQDIDFTRRLATLHTSKNGKPRLLPLTKSVMGALLEHKKDIGQIFPNTKQYSNNPFEIKKSYATALSLANITNFRFHDLRHTCASTLAQNGATLLEIADVLGHSNTTVTQRYAHLCTTHKANLIDNIMGGI